MIEEHGFEAVPFRDPTPEEQTTFDNLSDFLDELEASGIYNPDLNAEEMMMTLLVLNTSPENN